MPPSFERLIREHQAIAASAHALGLAIGQPRDPDAAATALKRLSDMLADHLATEDAEIYPRLILSADSGAADAARAAITEFETLAADWDRYAARWTRDAIAGDWDGFVAASDALLDRLARRVACENDLLYPMALRGAQIRLRG